MKLIVGLGNPGPKYRNNRHNVGFMIADIFAVEMGLSWKYNKDWLCFYAKSSEFVLIKPTTFMNSSGDAVRAVSEYFEIDNKDILVIHDEVDLEFGKIRLSFNGSSAGHKGVESVNKSLASQDFARLRVGVGRPEVGEVSDFVLKDFLANEQKELADIVARCEEAIKSYLSDGITATMNKFN